MTDDKALEADVTDKALAWDKVQEAHKQAEAKIEALTAERDRLARELHAARDAAAYEIDGLKERVGELEGVLRGFRQIAFEPCKQLKCYRPTLEMMKKANAALEDSDE